MSLLMIFSSWMLEFLYALIVFVYKDVKRGVGFTLILIGLLTWCYWQIMGLFRAVVSVPVKWYDNVPGFSGKLWRGGYDVSEMMHNIAQPLKDYAGTLAGYWTATQQTYFKSVEQSTPQFTMLEVAALFMFGMYGLKFFLNFIALVFRYMVWVYTRLQIAGFVDTFAEKMRAGSLLEPVKDTPSFQVEIWTRRHNGTFKKSGQGFNTEFGVFTAYHVVEDAEEIQLRRNDGLAFIDINSVHHLEGDVALIKTTQKVLQPLGVAQGKLTPLVVQRNSGLLVTVQAFGQRTLGMLQPDDNFGFCRYEGSTIPGFSGAPYRIAKQIYGMHIGGASTNVGYQAAYLYMLAKKFSEDTEDWLEDELKKDVAEGRANLQWQRSPFDPDEARIQRDGKYFVVPMSLVRDYQKRVKAAEYKQPDYEDEDLSSVSTEDSLPLAPRGAACYTDSENLLRAPAVVGAHGQEKEENVQPGPSMLPKGITLESHRDLVSLLSNGHPLTPVQRNEVLDVMSKFLRKRERQRQRRQHMKERKQQRQH